MNIQRSKPEQLQASEFAPVTKAWLPALSALANEILRCCCACLGPKAWKHIWEAMRYLSGLWERSKGGCRAGFYPSPQQPAPHSCLMRPQQWTGMCLHLGAPSFCSAFLSAPPLMPWGVLVLEDWGIKAEEFPTYSKNLPQQHPPQFGF